MKLNNKIASLLSAQPSLEENSLPKYIIKQVNANAEAIFNVLSTDDSLRRANLIYDYSMVKNHYDEIILIGPELDLTDVKFNGADLREAVFYEADLTGADLTGADLREAKFRCTEFVWAKLRRANLTEANLVSTKLMAVDLREANLTRAKLRTANLAWANLTGADLTEADLTASYLYRANLTGADLTGADLTWVKFDGVDLTQSIFGDVEYKILLSKMNWQATRELYSKRANLTGADLSGAKITFEQLKYVRLDETTILPEGFVYDSDRGQVLEA